MPRTGTSPLTCTVNNAPSWILQDELALRRILFRLYHIQKSLDEHAQAIRQQNKALAGLRQEQRKHEKALEEARAEQAKARGSVMQKEKRIKKAEKALETKVRRAFSGGARLWRCAHAPG